MRSATREIDAAATGGSPEADLVDKDVMHAARLASGVRAFVGSCTYHMFLFIFCVSETEMTGGTE